MYLRTVSSLLVHCRPGCIFWLRALERQCWDIIPHDTILHSEQDFGLSIVSNILLLQSLFWPIISRIPSPLDLSERHNSGTGENDGSGLACRGHHDDAGPGVCRTPCPRHSDIDLDRAAAGFATFLSLQSPPRPHRC